MLSQIVLKNLAIVEELEINFDQGMHVITGETGAGKSIIIDALSIALGERASTEQIRAGQNQAEVIACFNIKNLPEVQAQLISQELGDTDECIIRRIISQDGRSRTYINGISVSVQQIKNIAPLLVQIHGQHQHHALLESEYQRKLLDTYAEHEDLLKAVKKAYQQWLETKKAIEDISIDQQQSDKLNLINYQIQELENLDLQANELNVLEQKHRQLAKAEELLNLCQTAANILDDDSNGILNQLHNCSTQLQSAFKISSALGPCINLLQQASVQLQEASAELANYLHKLDLDPEQLQTIEQRLSSIHALARKLKIAPEFLLEHYLSLCQQRNNLINVNQRLEQLQQELFKQEALYRQAADKLSASRQKTAGKLSKEIIKRLKLLEMPNADFEIRLEALKHNHPTAYGNETINFMVTTNPGQPIGMLKKIASGGELSRISLAIQVITAQNMATPTLIMDEADIGISGKTAATVGQLMRELSANAQILCITHLAQVAAYAHVHFKVEKQLSKNSTYAKIYPLNQQQRTQELARLIGGMGITTEALAHASRMLDEVNS